MPNHVRNMIYFKGTKENLKKLFLQVLSQDSKGRRFFDFNKIVPTPEDFENIPSSTETQLGFALQIKRVQFQDILADYILQNYPIFLGGKMSPDEEMAFIEKILTLETSEKASKALGVVKGAFKNLNRKSSVTNTGSSFFDFMTKDDEPWEKKFLERNLTDEGIQCNQYNALYLYYQTEAGRSLFTLGEKALRNIQKYNAPTWYEWNCENWGTKWNSYANQISDHEIKFCTAWSCPEPIVQKLAELAGKTKGIEFTWLYADEDMGNNSGIFIFRNGTLQETEFDSGSDDALWATSTCWGVECRSESIFQRIDRR